LTEKKPAVIEVPDDRDLIITRAALSGGANGATVLSMQAEEIPEPLVFGTLRSPSTEQFELDCNIAAGSILQFSVKGPNEVHLTGYYNLRGPMDWEDGYGSGLSDLEDDSDEGLRQLLEMEGYNSEEDSSFTSVEDVEDVEISGDEEMGEEIESLSESPKKKGKGPAVTEFPTEYFGVKSLGAHAAKKPEAKHEAKREKHHAKPADAPKPPAAKQPEAKPDGEGKKKKEKKHKKEKTAAPTPAPAAATPETKGVKRPAPTTPEEKPDAKKQKTGPAPTTPPGAAKGFSCPVCSKSFKTEVGRDSHKDAMHK